MTETKSDWMKAKPAEVENLIINLHKEGHSPAKIGLILRDKHGIPKLKLMGKRITEVLKKSKNMPITEKQLFQSKIAALEEHIAKHKHDYTAKRSLSKGLWTVKKLN
jgi:small subunit ribosomal protein S15